MFVTFRSLLFVLLGVLVMASCRSIKPEVPSLPPQDAAVPAAPVSQIDIPIRVELKPVYEQIEKNVPQKLNSLGYPGWESNDNCLLRYKWNFWREKLAFAPKNNTLNITCIGYYQGHGEARPCCYDLCPWVGAGCGINEPPRQLQLGISSTVNITNDYKIISNTVVSKLLPVNRCYVTALNFDITDKIMGAAKGPIEKACKDFDNSMLKVNLRKEVENLWKMLYEPIPVDTFGFLSFNPSALQLSPITSTANTLQFSLGVTASPQFSLKKEGLPTVGKLPNITPTTQKAEGFLVNLDTRLQYDALTKMVNNQVKGMRIDFGKKHINIIEVQLAGTGNQKLMIKVNFEGSSKGWIYLTGTPKFDTATKELTLPDLDFDLKTRNVLLKSAKWLFDGKLTNTFRQNARYSIADMLAVIKTNVEQQLNKAHGYGISTTGVVKTVTISNIYPAPGFIQVTALIQGNLDVKVDGIK